MRAHIDHAFQAELGANRGGRDPVLAGPGLGNDPGLAHPAGEDDLAQHIVDLVRAGVVQLVPLQVDLGPAEMGGQTRREIQRRRAADIMLPQVSHFRPKGRVGLGKFIARFKVKDQRHQGFGHKTAAEPAKPTLLIGPGHEGIRIVLGHFTSPHLWPAYLAPCRTIEKGAVGPFLARAPHPPRIFGPK